MDTKTKAEFSSALLHPRYWPTWLLIGLWCLAAQLPYGLQLRLGAVLGGFTYHLAKKRRHICERNIDLCFPEKTEAERKQLVRENFRSTGIGLFETGMAWFASRRLRSRLMIEGADEIRRREASGEGVLYMALHFVTLEVLNYSINHFSGSDVTYRPHRNPVFDWVQSAARAAHNPDSRTLAAGDVRNIVRALKSGRRLAHLPDQDYGPKQSVFAPFFGVPTATVTAFARLAKMAKVPAIPVTCVRLENGRGYHIKVWPPLENFPTGDDLTDAARLNAFIEDRVREAPDQYLWVHRRFKTRPPGEADVYQLPKRSRRRRGKPR